jgi:hypothetical protein
MPPASDSNRRPLQSAAGVHFLADNTELQGCRREAVTQPKSRGMVRRRVCSLCHAVRAAVLGQNVSLRKCFSPGLLDYLFTIIFLLVFVRRSVTISLYYCKVGHDHSTLFQTYHPQLFCNAILCNRLNWQTTRPRRRWSQKNRARNIYIFPEGQWSKSDATTHLRV